MAAAESCSALPAGVGLPLLSTPARRAISLLPHPSRPALSASEGGGARRIAPVSQILTLLLTLATCGTAGILSVERNDVTPHCVALEGRYARDHPSHRPYRERPHGLGGFLRNGARLSRLPAHEHAARLCGLESARRRRLALLHWPEGGPVGSGARSVQRWAASSRLACGGPRRRRQFARASGGARKRPSSIRQPNIQHTAPGTMPCSLPIRIGSGLNLSITPANREGYRAGNHRSLPPRALDATLPTDCERARGLCPAATADRSECELRPRY